MIEQRIQELKAVIAGNDGRNAADVRFARAVDELVRAVYDDIGDVRCISSRALFDLFIIKVLYVGRGSRHAGVIEYLGAMLDRYLATRELFPVGADGKMHRLYFSEILDDERRAQFFRSRYEAYRAYADSALFLSGVFPSSLTRRRPGHRTLLRRRAAPLVDGSYYVSTGKAMYRLAAKQDVAEDTHQRDTLTRLAEHFELYVDALNEMSERYIMGVDTSVVADHLLDSLNCYKASHDKADIDAARRYAVMLNANAAHLPGDRTGGPG
ncbi:MAG: hypothetical protein WD359_04850 [Dehalococcoidia bacterium]